MEKWFLGIIGLIVGLTAVIVLAIAINTDKQSKQELESIDTVIASYEAPESKIIGETVDKIFVETTEAEIKKNKGVESSDNSVSDIVDVQSDTVGSSNTPTDIYKSVEELADEVLNHGINGDDRIRYLGDRYDEVQKYIDTHYSVPTYVYEDTEYTYQPDIGMYYSENALTPEAGVNYYNGIMETYYNLPMNELIQLLYDLGYSGTYWIREDGVKMFGDYIIVAADYNQFPRGTVVQTSLGVGMVLDTGLGGYNWFDIAVNWQ